MDFYLFHFLRVEYDPHQINDEHLRQLTQQGLLCDRGFLPAVFARITFDALRSSEFSETLVQLAEVFDFQSQVVELLRLGRFVPTGFASNLGDRFSLKDSIQAFRVLQLSFGLFE